jgi:integral membrane sensor domain MASE1
MPVFAKSIPSYTRQGFLYLVIGVIYFALGRLGQIMSVSWENVSPIWPASGFALAILLLYGSSLWPGIFLGSFSNNIYLFLKTC